MLRAVEIRAEIQDTNIFDFSTLFQALANITVFLNIKYEPLGEFVEDANGSIAFDT